MVRNNKKLFIVLLAAAFICLAYSIWDTYFRERESVEYISRNSAGEAEKDVGLRAVIEGDEQLEMDLKIPSVQYTKEEAEGYFKKAADEIGSSFTGEGNERKRIVHDISLPSSFQDNPVSVDWQSNNPLALSAEGKIGNPDENGEEVTLTAVLTLGDHEERHTYDLTVFPSEDTAAADLLRSEAEKLNEDQNSEMYYLPSELDGREVKWYETAGNKAGTLAVILLLAAVLMVVRERKQKENADKKRNEELKKTYPELISRILLFSYAGLSVRKAMYRIAGAYKMQLENKKRPERNAAFDEVEKICDDLDKGTGETESYERFGMRCSQAGYRTLSLLLVRSTSRGTSGLITALEQEAEVSFEDSKRRAKAAGDLAAVKLLLPMALMLVVVMVIVLVPSFLSFLT